MATRAVASFQRVARKCPRCRDAGPKEIVSKPGREFRPLWFLLLLLAGVVGLVIVPLWLRKTTRLAAHCPACGLVFKVGRL